MGLFSDTAPRQPEQEEVREDTTQSIGLFSETAAAIPHTNEKPSDGLGVFSVTAPSQLESELIRKPEVRSGTGLFSSTRPQRRPEPVGLTTPGLFSSTSNTNFAAIQDLQREVEGLEKESEKLGIGARVKRLGLSTLGTVVDLLSRPEYAIAGGLEAALDDDPETTVFKRFTRELFSGIGGLKGDKEDYTKVFEDLGVPELGRLSEVVPVLFNDDGRGLKFQKGGFFDLTGRGALGLTTSIVADPLTYLTGPLKLASVPVRGVGKKFLSKPGIKKLAELTKKKYGATDAGLMKMRRNLFAALPNSEDVFHMDAADSLVTNSYAREKLIQKLDEIAVRDKKLLPTSKTKLGRRDFLEDEADRILAEMRHGREADRLLVSEEIEDFLTEELGMVKTYGGALFRPGDIAISDLSVKESEVIRRAAEESAKQQMANWWINNPELRKKYFEDGGLRFMGYKVPGTDVLQKRMSRLSANAIADIDRWTQKQLKGMPDGVRRRVFERVLEGSKGVHGAYTSFIRMFNRDVAKDPGFRAAFQTLLDTDAAKRAELATLLERNLIEKDLQKVSQQDWLEITQLIDNTMREVGADMAQVLRIQLDEGVGTDVLELLSDEKALNGVKGALRDALKTFQDGKTIKISDEAIDQIVEYVPETMRQLDILEFRQFREDLVEAGFTRAEIEKFEHLMVETVGEMVDILKAGGSDSSLVSSHLATRLQQENIFENLTKETIPELLGRGAGEITEDQAVFLRRFATQFVNRNFVSNVPVYFDNRAENITQALNQMRKALGYTADEDLLMGKWRGYYSPIPRGSLLDEARRFRRGDPAFPDLQPINDIREIMRRRIDGHVEDDTFRRMGRLAKQYGIRNVPVHPAKTFDMAYSIATWRDFARGDLDLTDRQVSRLDAMFNRWAGERAEMRKVAGANIGEQTFEVNRGTRTIAFNARPYELPQHRQKMFKSLSESEQRYWIGRELLDARTHQERMEIFLRYQRFIDDNPGILPKFNGLEGYKLADFTATRLLRVRGSVADTMVEVPVEIFDHVTRSADEMLNSKEFATILRRFDGITNIFKVLVTVPFPSFHLRNGYSNLAQVFTDISIGAFDPKKHTIATQLALRTAISSKEGRELLRLFGISDKKALELGEQIAKSAKDFTIVNPNGVAYSLDTIEELARREGIWTDATRIYELVGDLNRVKRRGVYRKITDKLRQAGTLVENESRLMSFMAYLERGLTPEEAAARVKKYLFDYSNLSDFEKTYMRRLFPFYTWFRKNVPLQVRNLYERPGRLAVQADLLRQREQEKGRLAMWDIEGTTIRLSRDGNRVRVLKGIDLPFTQLNYFDALMSNPQRQREVFSMLNPLFRVLPEIVYGKSFFSGKPISPQEHQFIGSVVDEHFPDGVKKFLNFRKRLDQTSGRVRYEFNSKLLYGLTEAWGISRMLRTSDKAFEAGVLRNQNTFFLQWLLTGTESVTVDLTEQDRVRWQRRKNAILEELNRRGARRQFEVRGRGGTVEVSQ